MGTEILRNADGKALDGLLARHPVVAILGARQVGKTTLARQVLERRAGESHVFDLESPRDQGRLADPLRALEGLRGLVVLDEVQLRPGLFPVLRVLADRPDTPARFLVLGSATPELLRQGSETLAGRIAFHRLDGLALDEVGPSRADHLWLRGGFPRSFLARTDSDAAEWRRDFIGTFLERDIGRLGVGVDAGILRRFWSMIAHWHGQTWNGSALAGSLGVSGTSVRRHLDLLEGTFAVRVLRPWHENLSKRQVKAPKVYVADTGILHTLLDLATREDLDGHPRAGASWEGFGIAAVARRLGARADQCYFWATHAGAELDLLVAAGRRRLGFEFKRSSSPEATKSMHVARKDLGLESLTVIHPGLDTYPLAPGIRAVALARILDDLEPLRGAG